MTPSQKTEAVLAIVKESRRWFKREEYVAITNILWDALEASEKQASATEESKNGDSIS